MKPKLLILILFILLPQIINAQQRFIAVTIDDLPVVALQKDFGKTTIIKTKAFDV